MASQVLAWLLLFISDASLSVPRKRITKLGKEGNVEGLVKEAGINPFS